ncbi:glycosyltransferase family 4 protein [Anaeromyxobacter dehalogenans]|uniref:Glycosyl transferase, group 1 n=1 Tax=Anaeromyxobacter dehalogenans (strain 2CP-C) TaxID=290397 RepID=Q2IHI7_ANADE|nr:glycosyltransferase family 4 protein [Anaeromyxobacter dehalogenans]ABC84046.1 glycosyl transferase, group 1 [Anaeromyxobacter dehalogenans 2CP-C]
MHKVLHVFYEFLPHINGSCVRSAGLLGGQRARGIPVAAISSPFQPGFGPSAVEDYNGITLYRCYRPGAPTVKDAGSSLMDRIRKVVLFPRFVLRVRRAAQRERATVLHAHSTFYCGCAAYLVARSLGISYVYEFRSIWEERARALGLLYRLQAHVSVWLETLSLRLADRVVAINEGLKAEIVSRGIPAERVTVAPNAVDDDVIETGSHLSPPHRATRFGYVGTFYANEGLDLLVEAFHRAFAPGVDASLVFHGSGPFESQLRQVIEQTGDSRIRVCGPFTRPEVESVYRTIDCVVLPRRATRLNEVVTPLKPLEAMAFSRLVGVSEVGGLLEVVGGREHAWTFPPDDVGALSTRLRAVYDGQIDAASVAAAGRTFVVRHRGWKAVAAAYSALYSGL